MRRSSPTSCFIVWQHTAAGLRVMAVSLAMMAVASCKPTDPSAAAGHADGARAGPTSAGSDGKGSKAEGAGPTNRIALPAPARQTLGVVFAKAELRAVQRTQRIPGRIELRPGAVRTYHAPLSGPVILAVGIMDRVEAGATLGTLRPPELRSDQDELHRSKHDAEEAADHVRLAEARRAEADKTIARLTKRIRTLESASARKADLESDADSARSHEGVLDAELRAARSKLERERHHFEVKLQAFAERVGEPVATFDLLDAEGHARWELVDAIVLKAAGTGTVTALPRGLSGWVEAGEALVEVTDMNDWWFSGWALEADLPLVATVSSANIVPARGAPPTANRSPCASAPAVSRPSGASRSSASQPSPRRGQRNRSRSGFDRV